MLITAVLTSTLAHGRAVQAQPDQPLAPAPDWELTGLTESALQLFTPTSGALFARTQTGLSRSDNGGDSWRPVSLPPGSAQLVAVDPTDHTIVYAAGQAGLNKSTDDARTWQVIFPASSRMPVVTLRPPGAPRPSS